MKPMPIAKPQPVNGSQMECKLNAKHIDAKFLFFCAKNIVKDFPNFFCKPFFSEWRSKFTIKMHKKQNKIAYQA